MKRLLYIMSALTLTACNVETRPGQLPHVVNCDTDLYQTATLANVYRVLGDPSGHQPQPPEAVARLHRFASTQYDVCARNAYNDWADYFAQPDRYATKQEKADALERELAPPTSLDLK